VTFPLSTIPVLALDTETTGVDNMNDRIVTCCMVYDDGQGGQHIRNWMIDPGIEIPEGASNVHGVTTEIARANGVSPLEGLTSIRDSLVPMMEAGVPILVYNASFDLTLLYAEFHRYGIDFPYDFNKVIDPLVMDKQLDKFRKGKRILTVTASLYGYELENAHNAEADCLAAIGAFRGMVSGFGITASIEELHELQKQWKAEQAEGLQRYFRKTDPEAVVNGEWPYQLPQMAA
jgi:DNA polymerase-3 subunit epsilon